MNTEISTLKNGLRVVALPMKERNSVSVGIWVAVGGRHEEPRVSGVSHFLEHIVFKGTARRDAHQIKESVEGVGGSLNAFTSEEYTCFLARASSRHFEPVFDVLADMVLNASLKDEDIRKERTVILEEIKMTQDQPSQLSDDVLTELMWPDHPLGRPLAGTIESVSGLTRGDIADYRDRHYRAPLVTVTASGDVTQKHLMDLAEAAFSKNGGPAQKSQIPFTEPQTAKRLKILNKRTEQIHLALGLHTPGKDHKDHHTLDLLGVLLGGNMSSRLFNEVREERGLAYDISAFSRRFHETGAFVVSAGVDIKKLSEALEVILKELAKITREPVGTDELHRAKEFYLGQLDLSLENTMNQMLWAGESVVCHGRVKTLEEVAMEINKVSAEEIRRVAGELFKTKALNLSIVGPVDEKNTSVLSQILGF